MFARYCRSRYGAAAGRQVRDKAKALQTQGDLDGHRIWNKVAEEIDKRNGVDAAVH